MATEGLQFNAFGEYSMEKSSFCFLPAFTAVRSRSLSCVEWSGFWVIGLSFRLANASTTANPLSLPSSLLPMFSNQLDFSSFALALVWFNLIGVSSQMNVVLETNNWTPNWYLELCPTKPGTYIHAQTHNLTHHNHHSNILSRKT